MREHTKPVMEDKKRLNEETKLTNVQTQCFKEYGKKSSIISNKGYKDVQTQWTKQTQYLIE